VKVPHKMTQRAAYSKSLM